jgi:hypothetical protein
VIEMMLEEELVIVEARREAEREAPGEPVAAGRAASVALRALEGGASVPEAIAEARHFAKGWAHHRLAA